MSQREKNQEPPRRDDEAIDRDEDFSDAEAGEFSFDDLPFANPTGSGRAPFVRELQKRAETSVHEPAAAGRAGDPDCLGTKRIWGWRGRIEPALITCLGYFITHMGDVFQHAQPIFW